MSAAGGKRRPLGFLLLMLGLGLRLDSSWQGLATALCAAGAASAATGLWALLSSRPAAGNNGRA